MLYAVVMAGGRGERFWPFGREDAPKQFLRLFGDRSLLQATVDRLLPLVPWERLFVVTTARHAPAVREHLPDLPADHVLEEPVGRNTAPCIALSLAALRRRGARHDDVMAVFPADHWIGEEGRFRAVLQDAAAVAAETETLVTVGIEPERPETGYGYIQAGAREGFAPGGHSYYRVRRFVEKPSRERAEAMLAEGGHYWNSGMFIWRLDALAGAFERYLPEVARWLPELGGPCTGEAYRSMPSVSIDVGVMERAERVMVIPADLEWSDVGTWDAVARVVGRDACGNAVRGRHVGVNSRGCIVVNGSDNHVIATIGLEDIVVVHTPDATLVCRREDTQRVREVVQALREHGYDHCL